MNRLRHIRTLTIFTLLVGGVLFFTHPPISVAPTPPAKAYNIESSIYAPLVEKLASDGYAKKHLQAFYAPGNDVFYSGLTKINLVHREHADPYEAMYNSRAINAINAYVEKHRSIFDTIYEDYRVSPGIIGAILYVESRFGESSGDHPVLYVLSSMTLAPEEWNIQQLIEEMDQDFPNLTESERQEKIDYLRRRASLKADWAYRELTELLDIRKSHSIEITELEGSWAGAFGMPQFMPSSFNAYAVDGDEDGATDITTPHDAIASVANYLYRNGWRGRLTEYRKRKAIWRYNHSKHYVNLIVKLANAVES